MKVALNQISLVGTDRKVAFEPGLNIITGPIASGKSTLLRLCRGLLGAGLDNLIPEVREHVNALAGDLLIGDSHISIVRLAVSTKTAKVDIATGSSALRLPAMEREYPGQRTFGDWLLEEMHYPALRVPTAPSKPESESSPLTINDFFLYCHLTQQEIDQSVFGHQDPFKNIKRKYVFEVIYGIYDIEIAIVQEQLRTVYSDLRSINNQSSAFEKLLEGTAWENRAQLQRQLADTETALSNIEEEVMRQATFGKSSAIETLRSEILRIDEQQAAVRLALEREERSIEQLTRLINQLESQSGRLTKAIVAETYLSDFDFKVCPRCGASVDPADDKPDQCYLCHRVPSPQMSRKDLINEQERIMAQREETDELIRTRQGALIRIQEEINQQQVKRRRLGEELDYLSSSFVSDKASGIAELSAQRASLKSDIDRYRDYLRLYSRMENLSTARAKLESEKERLESQLDDASLKKQSAENNIKKLEANFQRILDRVSLPQFLNPKNAFIDRTTYLPVIDGRKFENLSSPGLEIFVNFAHALAHHETAIELGLNLPGLLFIDGLTSNVGKEGFDIQRVNKAYDYLIEVSDKYSSRLQIILADGFVPPQADPFVKLRLSEDDRLVPIPGQIKKPPAQDSGASAESLGSRKTKRP
ncbi:MAG: AAA family ATPase [Acidobacteriia bacterium]|nr:AAA family ATPase [Terriglobia bacterium]